MSQPKGIAASVKDKLRNIAVIERKNFDDVFRFYVIERLLYRLSQSQYQDKLLLKGAMVFNAWRTETRRVTRDLDLLGFGNNDLTNLEEVFRDICSVVVVPDGLDFAADTVKGSLINQTQKYTGVRIKMRVFLSGTRTRNDLQVDVGFGNVITPEANFNQYPTLLDFPAPIIKTYPPETVVAEKFQAIVSLSLDNTRLKDYYDLANISQNISFDGEILCSAIRATFTQRKTPIPASVPLGLADTFVNDPDKQRLLAKFYREAGIREYTLTLTQLVEQIRQFILPVVEAIYAGENFPQKWEPEQSNWSDNER